jgi:hypothetical protein
MRDPVFLAEVFDFDDVVGHGMRPIRGSGVDYYVLEQRAPIPGHST